MKNLARWSFGLIATALVVAPVRADLRTSYAEVTSITPTVSMRDLAVNKNPHSPYYGYVYVSNVTGNKVHILRPAPASDGTSSAGLVDTGRTITASVGSSNLFGLAVGSDDTVWLGVYGTGYVETAPPYPAGGDTDVVSVRQFMVTGGIRGIGMTGSLGSANVWIQTNDVKAKLFSGGTSAWNVAGSFTETKVVDLKTISANVQVGYGLGVDSARNAYVGLSYNAAGAAAPLVAKVMPDGTIDGGWGGDRPSFATIANSLADAEVVEDPSAPGGGYVYWSGRQVTGGANKRLTHRYRLDNGAWLDSFGPAAATGFAPPTDGTYTVLDLPNAASPHYFTADDKGNLYLNSDNQATVRKVTRRVPFVVNSTEATSAAMAVKSSPTAVDGVVYFGADDGKLYAYTTEDGNPVAGFPRDISAAVGATVQILGRPSVYFGAGGKAIYLTTNRGDVVKVMPDGSIGWAYTAKAGASTNTATTPAVTSNGSVFAAINGTLGVQVVKLAEADGTLQNESVLLALGTGSVSSPAVEQNGARVYVGTQGGTTGDLWLLNGANLTVQTSFAMGEGVVAPPHVNGPDAYVGTMAGNLYKVNSANAALDMGFGTSGAAPIGEPIVTDAFPLGGALYVGSNAGKVWDVDATSGAFSTLYDTNTPAAVIGGLVVNHDSQNMAFGTSAGKFYVVPVFSPSMREIYPGYGAFTGTPTYDRATGRFLIGSGDSNVYTFGEPAVAVAQ